MEREPTVEAPPGARARHDPRELAAIFAGGFLGAIARTALVRGFAPSPGHWPWTTFAVNLLGAGLLGFFIGWLRDTPSHPITSAPSWRRASAAPSPRSRR